MLILIALIIFLFQNAYLFCNWLAKVTLGTLHLLSKMQKYLYFLQSLTTVMTQVVQIFHLGSRRPIHPTWSMSWLLMTWRRKSPGHQQPWHWPTSPEYSSFSTRRTIIQEEPSIHLSNLFTTSTQWTTSARNICICQFHGVWTLVNRLSSPGLIVSDSAGTDSLAAFWSGVMLWHINLMDLWHINLMDLYFERIEAWTKWPPFCEWHFRICF